MAEGCKEKHHHGGVRFFYTFPAHAHAAEFSSGRQASSYENWTRSENFLENTFAK
ncbi:MAG: hypothetical protein QXU45_00715 [Candidatus Bathyarchaeia archaeon]